MKSIHERKCYIHLEKIQLEANKRLCSVGSVDSSVQPIAIYLT